MEKLLHGLKRCSLSLLLGQDKELIGCRYFQLKIFDRQTFFCTIRPQTSKPVLNLSYNMDLYPMDILRDLDPLREVLSFKEIVHPADYIYTYIRGQ